MSGTGASAARPQGSRGHIPGLDGIRGLAILMVMISHFLVVGENLEGEHPIHRFLMSGYLGVDLFFVLSGFLITGILVDARGGPNYFKAFYIRRALRIFPLYYGLLTVAWLSTVFLVPGDRLRLTGEDSMLWYWAYASNIGMAVKGDWLASPTWIDLGHFWSLAVEEQFYLVWPLVVLLLPLRHLRRLCLLLVLSSPFTFPLLSSWLGDLGTYVSTLSRTGPLAAGAWLAMAWRDPRQWRIVRRAAPTVLLVAGVLLVLERSLLPALAGLEQSLILLAGVGMIAVAAQSTGPLSRRFFESSVLRWLGRYSYGLYVYHHALKTVWIHFLWDAWIVPLAGTGWMATLIYTASAGGLSLGLAWLSWQYFEAPILSLKSRFRYGRAPDKRTPAVSDPPRDPV